MDITTFVNWAIALQVMNLVLLLIIVGVLVIIATNVRPPS